MAGDPRIVSIWAVRTSAAPVAVWPDGCRDLIVRVEASAPPAVVLTGLDTAPRSVRSAEGAWFIGVRLAPGTTVAWAPTMGARRAGDIDVLRLVAPPMPWLHRLVDDPSRAATLLLEAVARWVRPPDPLVEDFLCALPTGEGLLPRLGLSERTLRRRIGQLTGASPVFWVQLHRARAAVRHLASTRVPIAQVALELGYADQAHLTHAVRRWFGTTPGAIRARDAASVGLALAPDAFVRPSGLTTLPLAPAGSRTG